MILNFILQSYNEILEKDFDKIKVTHETDEFHLQEPCTNPFHQHNSNW